MPDLTHPFVSAVADDADASTVSPSNWNDYHATTLVDSDVLSQFRRMVLHGTQRLTAASSAHVQIQENPVAFMGSYAIAPTVYDGNFFLQYKEARLQGTARATLVGSGELYIFDLAPVGRLVLAGRGG